MGKVSRCGPDFQGISIHITCMYIFPFFDVCMYVCGGVAGSVVVDDLIFGGVGHSGSGAYPVVSCPPNNSTIA